MIALLMAIAVVYAVVRSIQPVFVIRKNKSRFTLLSGSSLYQIHSTEKVIIPTGQWREIPTGVTLAPFGVIKFGKHTFYPFGRLVYRVYTIPESKLKGLEILPTVYSVIPRQEIVIIGTGWNPKSAFVVHEGDPIAYVEFYRVPFVKLLEMRR